MNVDTGAIASFETKEDAKLAGYTLTLTAEQANSLLVMSHRERREWAKTVTTKINLETQAAKQ